MDEIAFGVVRAHILPHGATFELFPLTVKGNYLGVITHPSLANKIEETINTAGLPQALAEEYMHCRMHSLAGRLISKLYP